MKHWRVILAVICLAAIVRWTSIVKAEAGHKTNKVVSVSPTSLTFNAIENGPLPQGQSITVTAPRRTRFTATASVQNGRTQWLFISPSGSLTTNQTLAVSVNLAGLAAGTYSGAVSITSGGTTQNVGVTLVLSASTSGGSGTGTGTYKLIGWNDLGMHCFDGADFSVFGVLPPYNTIHAHLIDPSGNLIVSPAGYTLTYQAVSDQIGRAHV